jgi:hypothetical protein
MAKNESWTKYTFACDPDECDTLIEVTCDNFGFPLGVMQITCPCGRKLDVLSVADATILPVTTQKEEKMENIQLAPNTYNSNALVTYKKIAGTYASPEAPEYITQKVVDLEWQLHQGRTSNEKNIEYNNKINKLENVILSAYEDSDDQETLATIADIFNIELSKEITVHGTMSFQATIRVPVNEDYDLESMMQDELSVTSYGGDTDVFDYSVEDVREAY